MGWAHRVGWVLFRRKRTNCFAHHSPLANWASSVPRSFILHGGCFLLAYLILKSSRRNRSLFILGQLLYIAKCGKFSNTRGKMFYLLRLSSARLLLLFPFQSPWQGRNTDPASSHLISQCDAIIECLKKFPRGSLFCFDSFQHNLC